MEPTRKEPTYVRWEGSVRMSSREDTIDMLLAGKIAGICLPGFFSSEECRALTERVDRGGCNEYQNVLPKINRIGITVFEYDKGDKRCYFSAVPSANDVSARITSGICDPIQRVIEWLKSLSPSRAVGLAYDNDCGYYFAGLFRRIENGTLIHVDFAPSEHPTWSVAAVQNQLAVNIYLSVPASCPGTVKIWRKQWSQADERYRIPNSYGYRLRVIRGVEFATISPRVGMLMAINTKHFHQVTKSNGRRLTFSAALGHTSDDRIILWS